jgi:CheY-like chemotaxis protein
MYREVNILVVDDEIVVVNSCERVLKEEGFNVRSAMSGKEAMSLMEEKPYDLAFVDIKMPDIDGITLIGWIKRSKPDTEIGVITGYPSPAIIEEAINLGCFDYLAKPFTPQMLTDLTYKGIERIKERTPSAEIADKDLYPEMAGLEQGRKLLISKKPESQGGDVFEGVVSKVKGMEGYFRIKGGNFKDAGCVAKELRAHLLGLGIPRETIKRAVTSVFEAEMNVIIFAIAGVLYFSINDDELNITISDIGPGIANIELAMMEGYSTAPDWIKEMGWGSGMGLPNIKAKSDSLKIHSVFGMGTTLEIIINIKERNL